MFEIIKNNVNIVMHIEKYTQLRQAGSVLHGLCPIHQDKQTPSLTVYVRDSSWFCFGCNLGGSVIDFEMHRQSLSPNDAFQYLCEMYNIHPSPEEQRKYQKIHARRTEKKGWLDSLDGSLLSKQNIKLYLEQQRHLSQETIATFQLGAGEVNETVVIPIFDKFGHIVGFSQRFLDPNAPEKYKNDYEDEIYHKSEIWYNLDKAKEYIRKDNAVVLNEGYFDVMSLWEAGIKCSIAYCGSRIIKQQLYILQDMVTTDTTIYFVDANDKTAKDTIYKNQSQVRLSCPMNQQRVLMVPQDCKDLNDVLIKYGKEKIKELFDTSIAMELYLVKRVLADEPIIENQYVKVKRICNGIKNLMIVDDISKFLAVQWKKTEEMVRSFLIDGNVIEGIDPVKFKTIDVLINEYDEYIKNIDTNRINFGWPKTDKLTRGMRIGDVVQFIASTNVGKTLWAESLILNLTRSYPNMPVIFFSLEQIGIMAFERFLMMESGYDSKHVERWDKNEDTGISERLFHSMRTLSNNMKNFLLVDENNLTIEQLEEYVKYAGLTIFNNPVKVVVIDYLGYLKVKDGKDFYQKTAMVAKAQKEMSKRLKCITVSLHQITKEGKTGGDPVDGYMARDAGQVQECADIMFGAWRPCLKADISEEEKRDLERVYKVKIIKNRYGVSNIVMDYEFDPVCLRIGEERDRLENHVDLSGKVKL